MRANQADRTVIAARAAGRTPTKDTRVSRNVALRTAPPKPMRTVMRKSRGTRLTSTQRNSLGQRSEWSASPYYVDSITIDARWDRTVQS